MATPSLEDQLLAAVQAETATLISTTQTLVQTPSPNPPGNVTAVAHAARDAIQSLIPSSTIKIIETAPGITNLVAIIRGKAAVTTPRRLVFSGHLDTYPTGDPSRWTLDPFSGALENDKIYGRGVADMKGGIAASIIAAAVLARMSGSWGGEVVLALAGDEETMGTLGTGHLLEHVDEVKGADAMICGDAGSPLVVRAGEKGLLWLEVEASGKPAHGAHVHKGVNAIDRLLGALQGLKSLQDLAASPPEEVKTAIAAAKPISEPLAGDGEADVLGSVTVNIGTITGGTSTNLVADAASASLDIRIPMGLSTASLTQEIKQRLGSLEGVSYNITRAYEPSWTSLNEEIVQHALDVSKMVTKKETVANMRVGASDARLFRAAGVPSVVVGLTPHNMGGPDEFLEVEDLVQVAQIHALMAYKCLAT